MFAASYIIILAISSGLCAWGIAFGATRAAAILQQPPKCSHGTAATLTAIAFLVVVAAPPPVMVGSLFLLVVGLLHARHAYPRFCRWVAPALAVAFGLTGLAFTPLPDLPVTAIIGLTGLGWLLMTYSGEALSEEFFPTTLVTVGALTPLLASSWFGGPTWIALDVALMISAFAGALIALGHPALSGIARSAIAYLTGWMIVEAALHNAWIPAAASLTVWMLAAIYTFTQDPARYNRAFDF